MSRLVQARKRARTGPLEEPTGTPQVGSGSTKPLETDRPEPAEVVPPAVEEPKETSLPDFGFAEDVVPVPAGERPNGNGAVAAGTAEPAPSRTAPEPAGASAVEKYVTFFLSDEEYALPIGQVQEINRVGEISRVPNAPAHVLGVVNLRGKILPVVALKRRLGLGETTMGKENRIVVAELGPKVTGLLVDRVSQVVGITADQIEAAPEEVVRVGEDFIRGVAKCENRMIVILDLERVIGRPTARVDRGPSASS